MTQEAYLGDKADPSSIGKPITPSDDTDLPFLPRALYVNEGGTLVLREPDHTGTLNDNTYTVVTGALLPFRPVRVMETGTTASVVARG